MLYGEENLRGLVKSMIHDGYDSDELTGANCRWPLELRLPLTIEFTSLTSFSLSNLPMELEAPDFT